MNLREYFSPGGILSQSIPGYQERPEQAQMAERIAAALENHRHCLVEAGTGVGKSLSYLVPGIGWALEQGQRLVVSTHTKALQAQLVDYELPRLNRLAGAFPREFRFELCVGAENYLCLLRLIKAGQDRRLPALDPDYLESLKILMAWCRGAVSGLRQEAPGSIPESLWQQVGLVKELCLGRHCQFYEDCYLTLAKQRQKCADVLVTNHSLFFSNLAAEGRLLPEFGAAVLDEAHKVEDVAADFLGAELGQLELRKWLQELGGRSYGNALLQIRGLAPETVERIMAEARALAGRQELWWQSLMALFSPVSDTLRWQENSGRLPLPEADGLRGLAEEIWAQRAAADTEEETKILQFLSSRLGLAADTLDLWQQRLAGETVYWAEASQTGGERGLRVYATPLDLSRKFRSLVLDVVPSVVFCSATIAVGDQFSYFRSRLGIAEAEELVLASPFPYETNAALYLPAGIPDPRETEAYEERLWREIARLTDLFDGGLFVLFTSYRALRRMAERMRESWPASQRCLLVQGEEPARRLLKRFREDHHAVLLGVETFWQGVDVPGDALRCVVITRLPFDVPTHPVHQARAEHLAAKGFNPFAGYSLPRAVLMLRQGFGRLIRRHHDRGVVAILDPRVHTRVWGKRFTQALPACRHLQRPEEVAAFVREHFSESGEPSPARTPGNRKSVQG